MAGSKIGGIKAAKTNKERHGEDFYARIGRRGGKNGVTGGFATKEPCECRIISSEHIKPQCAGTVGGRISKRGKKEK